MTTEFVEYEWVVSLLFALAALGAEQLCARYAWPRRFLWVVALAAALAFPLSRALTTRPDTFPVTAEAMGPTGAMIQAPRLSAPMRSPDGDARAKPSIAATSTARSTEQHFPPQVSLDRVLELGWLTLSVGLLLYFAFGWWRLKRLIAPAAHQEVDGVRVRVTDRLGPAVFGLIRPEILIPRWILDSPSSIRALALEHERQHLAAGDPTLLLGALIAVVLMPWNPVLWWLQRRLRFSVEADCDARVLKITADAQTYAEALLAVRQHDAFLPARSIVLTSSASWLERRIRIMIAGTSRVSRLLATSGSVWALALLGTAILLHAPGLAALGELRKLPPQDTKPGAERVQSIARARFPNLYDASFRGMARLVMVLNRDGSVVRAREQTYTKDNLPRMDLIGIGEAADLNLDQSDILYSDAVDIRPLDREGTERALGYIEYAVLKWPHDPMRTESRARAAVEAYYPELTRQVARSGLPCTRLIAVRMNDDGSVRQAHQEVVGCHVGDSFSGDEINKLSDFGVPDKELGRGGEFGFEAMGQPVSVHYTWPRHADDPPDVRELTRGKVNAALWQQHQPSRDTRDNVAIIARYFPDIEAHGRADLIRTIEGRRYRVVPWILFGRDGQIWQTGRALGMISGEGYVGPPLTQDIEALYPGTRVWEMPDASLRVHGVAIQAVWISPDSPVQNRSDVALGRRKDLLVNVEFIQEVRTTNANPHVLMPIVFSLAHAMNFGSPAGIGIAQRFLDRYGRSDNPVTARLIATEAGAEAVDLKLQTRLVLTASASQPPSDAWVDAATVRVRYGSSGTVDLLGTYIDPPVRVQIVLRPELLRDGPAQQ